MSEANYNKLSCDMVRVADCEAVLEGVPGSFCIEKDATGQRVMWHKLPSGSASAIAIRPVKDRAKWAHSWEWDGNEDRPTLSPSVHHLGGWHGWIRNGRMVSQ